MSHYAASEVRPPAAWSVKTLPVLVPGIAGMRGSMAIRLRPCVTTSAPHPRYPFLRRQLLLVVGTSAFSMFFVFGVFKQNMMLWYETNIMLLHARHGTTAML